MNSESAAVSRGDHAAYRPDVDGLRALAVVPVVLFHAGFPGLSGGYVGVDVFFVISGFLITGILQGDLAKGRFSLVDFYNRRIRRIFPALFAMLIVTTGVALFLLTPMDLRAYGQSLAATALFSSNLFFSVTNGYFAAESHEQPLLHTWSLAVEEQYYIFWPVILWAAYRWAKRALLPLVVTIGILSFALSILWTQENGGDAFYLPWTRVWELLIGSVIALRPVQIRRAWLSQVLSLAGLLAIAFSILTFDATTDFPGPMAAIPCIGAALCIIANRSGETIGARLLSLKPVVFIGLVSYSFYLWHWPFLAFARYRLMDSPPLWLSLSLAAAAFIAAVLSWRYIERPFRQPATATWDKAWVLGGGAATIAVVVMVAGGFYFTRGLPQRAPQATLYAEGIRNDQGPYARRCAPSQQTGHCTGGIVGGKVAVVWGDSHARVFAPVAARAAAEAGMTMQLYNRGGCPPLIDVDRESKARGCRSANEAILREIGATKDLGAVVVVARWGVYSEGRLAGERLDAFLIDDQDKALTRKNSRMVLARALDRTVGALRKEIGPTIPIILVEPVPEIGRPVPDCFARHTMWRISTAPCEFVSRKVVDARLAFARGELARIAGSYPNITLYPIADSLCDAQRCYTRRDKTILYFDDDHLNQTGALMIFRDFSLTSGGSSVRTH